MPTKIELLDRLKVLADSMIRLYDRAAKRQAKKAGIRKKAK